MFLKTGDFVPSCIVFQRDLKNSATEAENTGKTPFSFHDRFSRLLATRF